MKNLEIKRYILILTTLLIITDLSIFLNIPFLRQIFGFFFLTILPGLLILQVLKLDKLGFTEKFVLSIGLSISFLMFFGLLLNSLSLSLGYETPLVTIPLLILFNIAFIVLVIIRYKISKNVVFSLPSLNLSTPEKAFLIIPVIFPALSVFGVYFMNTTNNNIISMFLLFLIPIYITFVCLFNQKFPARTYPLIIFLIGISLVLMKALRSNHILGVDAHLEYYLFQTTLDNSLWSGFGGSMLDACLSISLLPTIYQLFLNLDPEIFFNVFYVVLFSLAPLIIFIISKKYVGDFYGFLASIFFISQYRFIFITGCARTSVALIFFALAMVVLFNEKISLLKKRILLIVFMASCVVSHYSTSYIFFFIVLGTFIGMVMLSKKYTFKKVINSAIVFLFFAFIFFWYSQITETSFNMGVIFIRDTLINLSKLFVMESRGGAIPAMLGEGIVQKGIPHKMEFVFTWLIFAYIGIGIVTLVRKYREMSFPGMSLKKSDFLKEKFEVTYAVTALICAGILVASVALPFIANYGQDRIFSQAITILSVFFVIGGIIIAKYLDKFFTIIRGKALKKSTSQVRAYVIILLVLIPYFLSVTGVTYQVFGYPRSMVLNSEGKEYNMKYVYDQDSYGAKWLGEYGKKGQEIYADFYGRRRLASQGKIAFSQTNYYWFSKLKERDGYIYLRYENVVNGELIGYHHEIYNMTDYQDIFSKKNEIYDSSCSKIYY